MTWQLSFSRFARLVLTITLLLLTQCQKSDSAGRTSGEFSDGDFTTGKGKFQTPGATATKWADQLESVPTDTPQQAQAIDRTQVALRQLATLYSQLRWGRRIEDVWPVLASLEDFVEGPLEEVIEELKEVGLDPVAEELTWAFIKRAPVHRFHHQQTLDFYYVTNFDAGMIAQNVHGYVYNGPAFFVVKDEYQGTRGYSQPVYGCFYAGGHYLSVLSNCEGNITEFRLGWASPNKTGYAIQEIWRLVRPNGTHLSTTSTEEVALAVGLGFKLEGATGYTSP